MFTFTASLLLAASGTLAGPAEVDQAVEREFRLYRIQVYNTYRTWRTEYDRRIIMGAKAFAAWKQAGGKPQQAHDVIALFRGAKLASLARVNRPLPALPQFTAAAPRAIAATTPPAQPLVPTSPLKKPARRRVERWEVRELAAGEQPRVALAANQRQRRPPQPSWKSVSKALYKGVVFGASRALPK
jgi:hypothetical protein